MVQYAPTIQPRFSTGFYPQRAILMQKHGFQNIETFSFDNADLYTHEAWCGRIPASQWIGASELTPEQIEQFD